MRSWCGDTWLAGRLPICTSSAALYLHMLAVVHCSPLFTVIWWSHSPALRECRLVPFQGITTTRLRTFRLRHFVFRHFFYRYFVYYDFPCSNRSWSDETNTTSIEPGCKEFFLTRSGIDKNERL